MTTGVGITPVLYLAPPVPWKDKCSTLTKSPKAATRWIKALAQADHRLRFRFKKFYLVVAAHRSFLKISLHRAWSCTTQTCQLLGFIILQRPQVGFQYSTGSQKVDLSLLWIIRQVSTCLFISGKEARDRGLWKSQEGLARHGKQITVVSLTHSHRPLSIFASVVSALSARVPNKPCLFPWLGSMSLCILFSWEGVPPQMGTTKASKVSFPPRHQFCLFLWIHIYFNYTCPTWAHLKKSCKISAYLIRTWPF